MSEAIFVEGLTKSLPMTVQSICSWSSLSERQRSCHLCKRTDGSAAGCFGIA